MPTTDTTIENASVGKAPEAPVASGVESSSMFAQSVMDKSLAVANGEMSIEQFVEECTMALEELKASQAGADLGGLGEGQEEPIVPGLGIEE
ncbi:hypothetical protein KAU11_10300 [Candidatus Babeliales bacterium]|nr:hypothetical protein [Candidatus Babeliales bacterium]